MKITFKNDKHRTYITYEVFENFISWYEIKHLRQILCAEVACDCVENKIGFTSTVPEIELEVEQGRAGCLYGYKMRIKK